MLEQIRKNSRSLVTSVLFSVLIAAFVISINHNPARCNADLGLDEDNAATVLGHSIPTSEFFFAWELSPAKQFSAYFKGQESRFKGQTLDALIERELFAHAAEKMGLTATEAEVVDMVSQGKAFLMGRPLPLKPENPEKNDRGFAFIHGKFSYEQLEQVLRSLGLTVRQFMEIQKRELLANKLRELMTVSTKISAEEAKQAFAEKNTKVKLNYVRISSFEFEQKIPLLPSEISTYAKAHETELQKIYEARKSSYQNQQKMVHLHRIWIKLDKEASDATQKSATDALTAIKIAIQAGSPFVDQAVSLASNQQSKGGDLGWRPKHGTGVEDSLEEKIFAAKPGDLIGPEKTAQGMELIQVDGFREGTISFADAKLELAEEQYRAEKSKALAKQKIQDALLQLKAGKTLSEIFLVSPGSNPENSVMPKVEETDLLEKEGEDVRGIGSSKELVRLMFSKKVGEWAGPLEIGGTSVFFSIKERKEPEWTTFETQKQTISREFQEEKAAQAKQFWASSQCLEAKKAGNLKVNTAIFKKEEDPQTEQNPALPISAKPTYEPCQPKSGGLPF